MKLSLPQLLAAGLGMLLIWCGITDRNPAAVLKAILTGTPIPGPGDVGSAVGNAAADAAKAGARAAIQPPADVKPKFHRPE